MVEWGGGGAWGDNRDLRKKQFSPSQVFPLYRVFPDGVGKGIQNGIFLQ
jgi:hypothetical protein